MLFVVTETIIHIHKGFFSQFFQSWGTSRPLTDLLTRFHTHKVFVVFNVFHLSLFFGTVSLNGSEHV